MSDTPSVLLPLIMATLSHKPLLSETQNNLLRDVKEKLNEEGIQVKNLKEKLDAAIDSGKSLGILTVQNDEGQYDKQISYRNKGNSSDEDCRGKHRGRSRSRSRRRTRIQSKSSGKRSGRSRRRA